MIDTEKEKIDKLYEQAKLKACNNKDQQAYIHPSEFGFSKDSGSTQQCMRKLMSDSRFKNVKLAGKDTVIVTLFTNEEELR